MPARTHSGRWLSLLAAILLSWTSGSVVQADVVLDGSLGAIGPLAGPDFTIDAVDGRTVSTNLFHSFSEFNLSSSQSATFTGPASIANILGRVTGGSASSIDGLLRSTIPDANLFLVNPNGMMFGPNASLDVQGSFHASTADYIGLADGTQFTALPSAQDALLTTAAPSAFGFLGNNPGSIDIDHSQLTVPQGETLSLVGGDISITGTNRNTDNASLTGASGTINLVSVASSGEASFTSPLNADGFSDYGDITVTESLLEVSGAPGGAVYIRGGAIVFDASHIFSDSSGAEDGGDIVFKGDSVLIRFDGVRDRGSDRPTPRIRASTSGAGRSGDVRIEAQSLTVNGGYRVETRAVGSGRGGDIRLDVDRFEFRDTAGIFATTDGSGRSGDFILNADSVHGIGIEGAVHSTRLDTDTGLSNPDATGNAGDMLITANTVEIEGRVSIGSFARGGDAGDVVVNAERVVVGPGLTFISSVGDGGDIILNVGRLEVRGGKVQTDAGPSGDAGDIHINADSILIFADGRTEDTTRIASFSVRRGEGDGGDIFIDAGNLEIRDGMIFTFALRSGSTGNVTIAVDSLLLDGGGTILPRVLEPPTTPGGCTCLTIGSTHISTSSAFDFSGSSGNIDITANTVTVRGGAAINAITASDNPGGNVTINADTIRVETDARIDTGSIGPGPGGDIILSARDLTLASGGNLIASSTGSGLAGDINISVTDSFQSDGGFISTEALASDGGNITVNATNLVHLTNSAITTSVEGGAGAGGNISIDPEFVVLNNSNIIANAFGGPGGNITIVAGNFIPSADSVVQASSQLGVQGAIVIDSPDTDIAGSITALPESFLDASALLPERCVARSSDGQSSFVVAGRGGVPIDPDGYLPSFHAAGLTALSASADSATDTIPETWISAIDVALLALVNSGCR